MTVALALLVSPALADPQIAVPDGYRMDDYRAPVPDTVPGATVLHVPELQAAIARGEVVLIDVLPAPRQPAGMKAGTPWLPPRHLSLPDALWWPEVGRGALTAGAAARLRQRLEEVSGDAPGRLLVFFCLPDCWMSWNAARRAASMGARAGWFPEGVDGWRDAGLPLAEVQPEEFE